MDRALRDACPRYWMQESSGVLKPAILAYLRHEQMTPEQIAAMRAYLRQWINAPVWSGAPEVAELRAYIDLLQSRDAIAAWFDRALALGIDPL